MKKLTIQNIEKLEGQIISEYRVQTIEVDDIHREDGYYIISCVATTIGTRYLTILINRRVYDGEHVKVSFETGCIATDTENRTAWFPVWLEDIQSVEGFMEKIKWNISNREWV